MQRTRPPDPTIRLKISGARDVEGDLAAKGELEFRIADASEAAIHFDYREDSRLVLGIRSAVGFQIGSSTELTLSGGVQHDLEADEWKGSVKAEIEFGRDVDVVIEQAFQPRGHTTSVALTIAF
ncbi:MAG TPA: hypothetical protein VM778_06960 [Gemmatimonadota bacterium]|nr:hypothetical protein [Gemmatimonadota bacterium]